MSQIIGFDFGTHNIGVAVGQTITGTASPLPALKAKDGQPDWSKVEKMIAEWQPKLLVVGLPLNMDGSEQPLTDLARKFANRLHGRFGPFFRLGLFERLELRAHVGGVGKETQLQFLDAG